MARSHLRIVGIVVLLIVGTCRGRGDEPPKPQYQFENIRIPGFRADEPKRKQYSAALADEFLHQGAQAWMGSKDCISCHTTGAYLTTRPALTKFLGKPKEEIRTLFIDQMRRFQKMPAADLQKSTRPAQVVYLAAGLAEWDAHVSRTLSQETREALKLMLATQQTNGTWGSLDCWPPYESDSYHLATVAGMAAGTAPGWLQQQHSDAEAASLIRLKNYLRTAPPPHDYGRVLLLWVSTRLPGVLDEGQRKDLIGLLSRHQRADGGWSLRSFATPEAWGSGNRADKLRMEPEFKDPPSDGHQTGLAIIVLCETGVPNTDSRIQRGVKWLKENQRESGRWWTRSLNTDAYQYISYSGTAFPLLALAKCGEIPLANADP